MTKTCVMTSMACGRPLAAGQWWTFCGETDMGQSAPALCTTCGGKYGFVLRGVPDERTAVGAANASRATALEKWKAAGYIGNLDDY